MIRIAQIKSEEIEKLEGEFILPFVACFIDEQLVVKEVIKNIGIDGLLKRGDIIETIDSQPVPDLIKKYLPIISASNFETQLGILSDYDGFLLRSKNDRAKLGIYRNSERHDISIPRVTLRDYAKEAGFGNNFPAYSISDSIGYIYPAKLSEYDLTKIKASLNDTKGIIIDMRCYPSTFMPFSFGEWLKPFSSEFARFTYCNVDVPGDFNIGPPILNGGGSSSHYQGKVVIIVNDRTQSQAEFTTMALATAPSAMVIGSTTAGADGNISTITLPGGIVTAISGIGVIYPDGTESQGKGVKIDKIVRPTIKGIREGRDELLQETVNIIKKQ